MTILVEPPHTVDQKPNVSGQYDPHYRFNGRSCVRLSDPECYLNYGARRKRTHTEPQHLRHLNPFSWVTRLRIRSQAEDQNVNDQQYRGGYRRCGIQRNHVGHCEPTQKRYGYCVDDHEVQDFRVLASWIESAHFRSCPQFRDPGASDRPARGCTTPPPHTATPVRISACRKLFSIA